jgi:hypothetical protein
MRRLVMVGGLALLALTVGGCVVVGKHTRSLSRPGCHPSQYWDGAQCRHKGNGHGARKHDGQGRKAKH